MRNILEFAGFILVPAALLALIWFAVQYGHQVQRTLEMGGLR
jgi:hypothetical protein